MRRYQAILWMFAVTIIALCIGCNGEIDPLSPSENPDTSDEKYLSGQYSGNNYLWGYYDVRIDPESHEAIIAPIREAEFTLNVTGFLQPKWADSNLVSIYLDSDESDFANGYVVCDVTLTHPFPGLAYYRGFDVRGIVMGHDSRALDYDYSARYAGPEDLNLLNPDGFTRWWNPSEFGPKGSLFGYIDGSLAPRDYIPTATLNGYKYFADEIGRDEPLVLDPANRGSFANNPGVNTRRYEIQFPVVDDMPQYRFGYAVDASWAEPDEEFDPSYPLEAFPPDANCAEAYLGEVTDNGTTAWYEGEGDYGGEVKLTIEIFDWQAADNPDGLPGELVGLWLEGEFTEEPVDLLSGAIILPGGPTSSVFEVEISNPVPTHAGPNNLWIIAESAFPSTYEPQIEQDTSPFRWPRKPLAAYMRSSVEIAGVHPQNAPVVAAIDPDEGISGDSILVTVTGQNFEEGCQVELRESGEQQPTIIEGQEESRIDETEVRCAIDLLDAPAGLYDVAVVNPGMMEGVLPEGFNVLETGVIYVDDSNTGGIEDGTMQYPFDSIQEGIDAADELHEVWVDDSGNRYVGQILMADDVTVRSINWDESDGDGAAVITVSNGTDTVMFGADGAILDGFEITGIHNSWYAQCGLDCDGASMEIVDCTFAGFHHDDARAIWLHDGSLSTIEYTEVYDINNNTFPGYSYFYGIIVENCDAIGDDRVSITHTVVHDVFSSGMYDGTNCDPHGILIFSSDGAQVKNSIIHNISGGSGHDVVGIEVYGSADVELVNNVIYYIDKTYYYGNSKGISFYGCENLDIRNFIISTVRKNWNPQNAWGISGNASTYSIEYSDIYNCWTSLFDGVSPGTGCISANPSFIEDGVDFHLKNVSPCIDTGDPTIFDPDESISDMGAYGGPGADW